MAISQKSVGAWAASNATTQTVTLPTHAAGDMLIVRVGCKPYTAAPFISTGGWAAIGTGYSNGTTSNGNGLGSVVVAAFYKEATSSSETDPVVNWDATSAPGAAVAVCYQKGAGETWETPVGAGGGDDTARTSQTATISSHISVTAGDMVDFFVITRDDSATTVPTITQTGVTYGTVAEYPTTALASNTSNDMAADGGYRLASSGTSSAAAVVTHTNAATESGAAWQTRLRVTSATFACSQSGYRFYDFGNPTSNSALAAEDTAYAPTVATTLYTQLRVQLQETGGAAGAATDDYKLQYNINSGGWTDVDNTTGASAVSMYNESDTFTHGGSVTTARLTAGSGSYVSGELADTSNTVTDHQLTASNYTEHVWSLFIDPEFMSSSSSQTIEFRVLLNGATTGMTYTVTPTINLTKSPGYVQSTYRFYEDGTESASTAIAAADTNITRDVTADSNLQLRIGMVDDNNFANPSTDDWQLQYNKNSAGWTNVGTGAVVGYNSSSLTEGAATTDRLGLTGFEACKVSEDGEVNDDSISAGAATEYMYSITIVAASVADGDLIDFRVVRNGSASGIGYGSLPRITVDIPAPGTFLFEEHFDNTDNTTITSGNSGFDIFNGTGTGTFQDTPTPIAGATIAAFDGSASGDARWIKNSTLLPGTVNGGSALRKIYARFYCRISVAVSAITRIMIFESSVGTGGTDVGGIRLNATGLFAIMDGTTSRGASTHAVSTTEWTRVELELDQTANTITARMWWGADVNSASTGATNYETWSGTLATDTDMEVFGIGEYATTANTILYIDEFVVDDADWIGPYTAGAPPAIGYFGIPMD